MSRIVSVLLVVQLILVSQTAPANTQSDECAKRTVSSAVSSSANALWNWLKRTAIDKTLDVMAIMKGLPAYLKLNDELKVSGRYLEYGNFGEMGLAEIGISVRYNQANFAALNTGKPLIIVANHHLGIADGLSLQYMAGRARTGSPTLLFLARWIEKLMPHAVYGDAKNWGTAIPVEINTPKESDPEYDAKMAAVKDFNSNWSGKSFRALRRGGALIIFPAGHVAAIEGGGNYPESVYDAPDSWQGGFLNLARLGKADIVFAHVDSVNSEPFYRDRKRFGGGDKERVIWFFSEALAKKEQTIDVSLSKPMSLEDIYQAFTQAFGSSREDLEANPQLTAELMRQFTYRVSEFFPQTLDTKDSPQKK